MIIKLRQFMESRLVPRNLKNRHEKLKQQNLRLLQQEAIDGYLWIDDSWNFESDQVKTRTINGNLLLINDIGYIPNWLKNITVNGTFNCKSCMLKSLNGCPNTVMYDFICSDNNKLTSLEGMPKYIGDNFYCLYFNGKFTEKDIPKNVTIEGKIIF